MSHDQQPKQPEPEKIGSQTPAPKPERDQSKSALQQVNQTLQQTWSRAQPVLRSQSIKVLRATIQLLGGVLAKLEAEPPTKTASTQKPSKSVQFTATEASAESQTAPGAPSASEKLPDQAMPTAPSESILDKLRPQLEQLQGWWNVALTSIRSWLPESVNQKLSDTALTGVTAGILVILLWTTSALLPGKSPAKVANLPPSQPPAPNLTTPPELSAPKKPQPVEVSPPPPKSVTPSPTLALSPEQQLIADIQTQVTEVGNQYANCLIQSVQPNFQAGRLIAKASDNWYNLDPTQQDKLAGELLNRAQAFNFGRLEIINSQGVLLARSPVVGNNMVILKRQAGDAAFAGSSA